MQYLALIIYYTLRAMCNSSLGVWKNTLSMYIYFYLPFCAKKIQKKKKKLRYVFVKFELNCNCDLYFIGLLKGLNISLCL
jgi:hypothetical protein